MALQPPGGATDSIDGHGDKEPAVPSAAQPGPETAAIEEDAEYGNCGKHLREMRGCDLLALQGPPLPTGSSLTPHVHNWILYTAGDTAGQARGLDESEDDDEMALNLVAGHYHALGSYVAYTRRSFTLLLSSIRRKPDLYVRVTDRYVRVVNRSVLRQFQLLCCSDVALMP